MPQWAQILQGVSGGVQGYYGGGATDGTPPAYPAGSSQAPQATRPDNTMRNVLIGAAAVGGLLVIYLVIRK